MIREVIVTTLNEDNSVHIAPMGIRTEGGQVRISPFKPSTTLENLRRNGMAVINYTDDVRIFAGCLTGHYEWQTVATKKITGQRLENTLSHLEVEVDRIEEDELRPAFICNIIHQETHAPFQGLNRAKAAVLECAVLVSRLHMLSAEKIDNEMKYLEIAIDKTAGPEELEAWGWLQEKIRKFRMQEAAGEGMV